MNPIHSSDPALPDGPVSTGRPAPEAWIVTSPKAGTGQGRQQVSRLADLLRSRGFRCTVTDSLDRLTAWARHDGEFDSESAGPADRIVVAAGGDGTVCAVAERVDAGMPIVAMPLGTENLLARHYGFTADAEDVLQTVLR